MLNDRSPLAYDDVKVSRGDDKVKQNHRSDENTLCSCTVFIKHSILRRRASRGGLALHLAAAAPGTMRGGMPARLPEEASPTRPLPAILAQGSAGKESR